MARVAARALALARRRVAGRADGAVAGPGAGRHRARGGGRRSARATVLRTRRAVLGGSAQSVPACAATGRRPIRAAATIRPAVSDDLLEAGSPCPPAATAGGDLISAGLPTARRGGIRDRGQNANTERQPCKPSEHLSSGHGLDLRLW